MDQIAAVHLPVPLYQEHIRLVMIGPELGTFEWCILGLMVDPLFFFISRLNNACSPLVINLQINPQIGIKEGYPILKFSAQTWYTWTGLLQYTYQKYYISTHQNRYTWTRLGILIQIADKPIRTIISGTHRIRYTSTRLLVHLPNYLIRNTSD